MADAQDRNLPASAKKIAKAREDGQVARSRDLGHLAAIGAGVLLLVGLAPQGIAALRTLLAQGLRFNAQGLAEPGAMLQHVLALAGPALWMLLPLGAVALVAALASGLLAGGWNFTLKPLRPKFDKFNPLTGITRLLSPMQLVDTLKSCLLALVLGSIGALYIRQHLPDFTALSTLPLPTALASSGALVRDGVLMLVLALAAFALVDVPLQRFQLLKRLKMSHQEVKQEYKQAEGNPEVKGQIKARMRQMGRRRMLAAVPEADLVVMNPTHYAVALKYDEASMDAPRVVAKGTDLLALRIRDLAREHQVPVLEAPPLARALYAHTEIDQPIPAALFSAVAQVLAWVYQLRQAAGVRNAFVPATPQPQVPAELDPHDPAHLTPRQLRRRKPDPS